MSRITFSLVALLSALLPLILDSALKGVALLAVAALCTLALWKTSAATRHLVWLVAVVALLIVPLLSVALPQWRVLPKWEGGPAKVVSHDKRVVDEMTGTDRSERVNRSDAFPGSSTTVPSPLTSADSLPTPEVERAISAPLPAPTVVARTWRDWFPLVWIVGCTLLSLRLVAAHFLLRRAARRCVVLDTHAPGDAAMAAAFASTCAELGVGRRVTLLLDEKRTIPVVWGVFRPHLLLPAEAREWGGEQLRSVLFHELVHLERRDPHMQWLTQLACALHWFNPLAWFAGWRIHVERERACDDLVLASGVRPSAYAEHLLHVATRLSPARWTQSCGLAMARKSSLEGRLRVVLSKTLNRRRVSATITAVALVVGAGVAIPVAMLRAAEEEWSPPHAAHTGSKDFSVYCVHDDENAAYIITYHGDFNTEVSNTSNPEARTCHDEARLELKSANGSKLLALSRDHSVPDKLSLGGTDYDLTRGRLFLVHADGAVRQLAIEVPVVTDQQSAKRLAERIAAIPPEQREMIGLLPDEAYTTSGVHCQKFREEDAKRPGGKLMGPVAETRPADRGQGPLVLGLRVASDANWTIGGEARIELVVRNASKEDVRFRQTPRSDRGLSVVAIGEDGKEHQAEIAQFASLPVWNRLLLPPGHVVLVKPFTIRCDAEKRVAKPGVAAFHLPPGDYKLRCNWGDAHPEGAHEGEWTGELVSVERKFTLAAAAAPRPAAESPGTGAQLKPATEQKLKWGEPVDGLRMALAWPLALDEPGMGVAEEFFLVVQNVSEAVVRLTANDAAPNPRRLMMRDKGKPLQAISDEVPTGGDWLLQPREVAFLRLFLSSAKANEGRTVSAVVEQDIRLTPRFSMRAEMIIEKAPEGAWTGRLETGETRGLVDVVPPKDEDAQALFKSWNAAARADGKLPGALIGQLAESVKLFIRNNPTWETTPQLEKMPPRFDATRDWSGPEAVALLDELAAVQGTPIRMAVETAYGRAIRTGAPLPPNLENVSWGQALPNGLRLAWLLEPNAAEHRLGRPLKSRLLIHNTGKVAVVFRTRNWHQSAAHQARDAKGQAINILSTRWTTRGLLLPFRLAPGEFVEVVGAGIGVGAKTDDEDWQGARVGSWIEAKEGEEVTFTPAPVPLSDWNAEPEVKGGPDWWLDHIKTELSRHLPFPADVKARKLLLSRVAMELFGTPVGEEINASFVADRELAAFESLAKRLAQRPGLTAFTGSLQSAPTTFRVLPADPNAAKRPRTASGPGRYTLGQRICLVITRRPEGERIVNHGSIMYYPPGAKNIPHDLQLPDGSLTWAVGWKRGATALWVTQKGLLRRVDFSNPAKVEETRYEAAEIADAPIPPEIREAIDAALSVPEAPRQIEKLLQAAPPASEPPSARARNPEEEKESADAGRPLQENLDIIDEKMAALEAEPKLPGEWARVEISPDGTIMLNRKAVTLEELKAEVAKHPDWRIDLDADERVPYGQVGAVADGLRAGGARFSYRGGRMGDGKLRVANRTANYQFDGVRNFSICRPSQRPQWFTVAWPASGARPRCALRIFPNVSEGTRGEWAVAWEPGAEVLWWVDDMEVGRVRLTNPARVLVTREGRENNFSRDFGLPEEVKEEFRRLGFVIGRDKTPGRERLVGGNTRGEEILAAETAQQWIVKGRVTGADSKPLADVPLRVRTDYKPTVDLATATTDANGNYRLVFRLDLTTLAAFRGVRVEPAREGFLDTDQAKSGEFKALLFEGEKPGRPGGERIRPLTDRDLVIGVPGRADFVLEPAGEPR